MSNSQNKLQENNNKNLVKTTGIWRKTTIFPEEPCIFIFGFLGKYKYFRKLK